MAMDAAPPPDAGRGGGAVEKTVMVEEESPPEPKEAGSEDGESEPLGLQDFMSYDVIEKNTRDYAHNLRADYDRMTRVDFTQTLVFASGKIVALEERANAAGNRFYSLSNSFNLNDQVSQFRISVNIFSSKGRLSTRQMTLTSALPAYNKFTLPTTLLRGDKVDIPITVVNNYDST
jgi:hypothetical protein